MLGVPMIPDELRHSLYYLRIALKRSTLYITPPTHIPHNQVEQYALPTKSYDTEPHYALCWRDVALMAMNDFEYRQLEQFLIAHHSPFTKHMKQVVWQGSEADYYLSARQWAYIQHCLTTGSLKRLSFFLYGKWLKQRLLILCRRIFNPPHP